MNTNESGHDDASKHPKNSGASGNGTARAARRAKIVRTSPLSNQLPGKIAGTSPSAYTSNGKGMSGGVGVSTSTSSSSNAFTVDSSGSRDDGTWLIDAIAIAISNISPPRGAAVRAMARLLVERSNVGARSATAVASEFAGVESEETCHAIAVLCADGWSGSLAELLHAARNV
jgi:hypothetical protein